MTVFGLDRTRVLIWQRQFQLTHMWHNIIIKQSPSSPKVLVPCLPYLYNAPTEPQSHACPTHHTGFWCICSFRKWTFQLSQDCFPCCRAEELALWVCVATSAFTKLLLQVTTKSINFSDSRPNDVLKYVWFFLSVFFSRAAVYKSWKHYRNCIRKMKELAISTHWTV